MKKIRIAVILAALVLAVSGLNPTQADQIATTEQGTKVVLRDNGTWSIVTPEEAARIAKAATPAEKTAATALAPEAEKPKAPPAASLVNVIQKSDNADFRTASWGMSRTEVKKKETATLVHETSDTLQYKARINEMDCRIQYVFVRDQLSNAAYIIEQPHVDPARYLRDYENLKRYLQPLYGASVSEKSAWKNDMYKDKPEMHGFAISIGFMERTTVWKGRGSNIELFISGGNHRITTRINYSRTGS